MHVGRDQGEAGRNLRNRTEAQGREALGLRFVRPQGGVGMRAYLDIERFVVMMSRSSEDYKSWHQLRFANGESVRNLGER